MAVNCPANSATSSSVSSSLASVATACTSARLRVSAMATNSIRPPAVAGTWYPATAGALAREVDAYVAGVEPPEIIPRGTLHAVIAPHAGLVFSGPVGAYAYKAAAAAGPFDAAILVGPSHYVAFDGVPLYPDGAFGTPLGPAEIGRSIGEAAW